MKTAIVTGGAKGIGEAIVRILAQNGIQVMIAYHTSEQKAKQLQSELLKEGKKVAIFKADLCNRQEVKELIEQTKKQLGTVDILVNNAGIDQIGMFTDIQEEQWNQMIQTNLTAPFYCIQEVLPNMIYQKQGCIINISSIWGLTGASCEVAYSVSKAGLDGLTKALAKEVAPSGIRVNSIAPGAIMTDMNASFSKEEIKRIEETIPMG